MSVSDQPQGILCVANWKSDVGYAWWLMESYWAKICEHFSPRYRVHLAYPEINTVPQVIEASAITCHLHAFAGNSWADIKRNIVFIKQHNIKVLYLSDYGVSSMAFAMYRLAGVRYIISHDHTPGLRTVASGAKKWLKTIKANFPLMSVDAGFGATEFVARRLHETSCLKQSKCFAIKNGIKVADSAETAEKKAKESAHTAVANPVIGQFSGRRVIVTAARANRYKGIDFALKVIAELVVNRGYTDIVYLLCGDGPDLQEFQQQSISLGIEANCIFAGRVEGVTQVFKHCYLGFQPSQGEVGYSLSILEYMYEYLPVIVPGNRSVCEATEQGVTGAIYTDREVDSAADAIALYLDDPALQQQHGMQAHKKVVSEYTLAATHQSLIKAMEKVIK